MDKTKGRKKEGNSLYGVDIRVDNRFFFRHVTLYHSRDQRIRGRHFMKRIEITTESEMDTIVPEVERGDMSGAMIDTVIEAGIGATIIDMMTITEAHVAVVAPAVAVVAVAVVVTVVVVDGAGITVGNEEEVTGIIMDETGAGTVSVLVNVNGIMVMIDIATKPNEDDFILSAGLGVDRPGVDRPVVLGGPPLLPRPGKTGPEHVAL
ncbi:MAG: hypothetical protein J3Q66DRAFT_85229 [Benniella sp.]|nr:MAG: hypothetical protein J3Q66DRAFT_85229 [Benniella sp.]